MFASASRTWPIATLLALALGDASAQIQWTSRNPLPSGSPFNAALWTGTHILAVGDLGAVFTSPDGEVWENHSLNLGDHLKALAHGAGRFVAVGHLAAEKMSGFLSSRDGRTWTSRPHAKTLGLHDILWTGRSFVAVGDSGTILTSVDGEAWTRAASGTRRDLLKVAQGDSLLMAVGDSGTVTTSRDGQTWTVQSTGRTFDLHQVAFGGGRFVVAGAEGEIVVSPDGHGWERSASGVNARLRHVAEHGGTWIAVGDTGTLLTSPDGRAWTRRATGTRMNLFGVAWCGSRWVATGDTVAVRSPDGIAWSVHSLKVNFYGIDLVEDAPVWSGSRMVVLGRNGLVLTSADGAEWQPGTRMEAGRPTPFHLWSIVWDGARFLGLARSGNLVQAYVSADGIAWSPLGEGRPEALWARHLPIRAGNRFIAAGIEGTSPVTAEYGWIALSQDGMTWSGLPVPGAQQLYAVAASPDRVVAVGFRGTILSSPLDPNLATRPARRAPGGYSLRGDRAVLKVIPPPDLEGMPFQVRLLSLQGEACRVATSRGAAAGFRLEGLAPGIYVVEVRGKGAGKWPLFLPYAHP